MLSYPEALALVLDHASPLPAEDRPLAEAVGYVLAADLTAATASPGFDNSAMDGFAVRAADTERAEPTRPARLVVRAVLAAGDIRTAAPLATGDAAEIMTGAPVPPGADTIIPVEQIKRDGAAILIDAPSAPGRNIRRRGSDFAAETLLLPRGTPITPTALPLLAASGCAAFRLHPPPRVWWISTGRELVDTPGSPLAPGQIYNSSGPYGAAAVAAAGAVLLGRATVGDDGDGFRRAMTAALASTANVVISTGAVSVGAYDFVRAALEAMGADILLHRVRVKPGKPILFARLPDGRFFFGLPGNPASTAMGFRMIVVPFLRALAGHGPERPLIARLCGGDVTASPNLTVFLKAVLSERDGRLVASPLDGQESYKVSSMALMNAWIVHPEGVDTLADGQDVACYPLLPGMLSPVGRTSRRYSPRS